MDGSGDGLAGSPGGVRDRPAADSGHGSRERDSLLRGLDWPLTIAVLCLSVVGAVLVWSATKQGQLDQQSRSAVLLQAAHHQPGLWVCCSARRRRWSATARCGHTRLSCTPHPSSDCSSYCHRSVARSTVRTRGSCCRLASRCSRRSSRKSRSSCLMAMILGEKRDGEDQPRDSDVLLVLGLRCHTDPAHHAAARPRHGDGRRVLGTRRAACPGTPTLGARPCGRRRCSSRAGAFNSGC